MAGSAIGKERAAAALDSPMGGHREQVEANSELNATHVILLTAKGQEYERRHGVSVGADPYVTKPFDPDHLLEIARGALQGAT